MGRLERMHCVLASRILERNESDANSDDESTLTQNLDLELQKAARSLPSKWWLMPNLDRVADDPRTLFWDMGRLFNQLYYNLLNQPHLPYMLRSLPERSRLLCPHGRYYIAPAHLGSHRIPQASNLLAHQYPSDRAMIEQAQMNMEQISRVNGDVLSAQSADLLQKLLSIESETIDGTTSAESVSVQPPKNEEVLQLGEDDNSVVRMQIPYFGIVRIARHCVLSRELHASVIDMLAAKRSSEASVHASDYYGFAEDGDSRTMAQAGYSSVDGLPQTTPQYQSIDPDNLLQQDQGPGLTAGMDDWAFQGVDMAFFDSLMKGVDEYDDL